MGCNLDAVNMCCWTHGIDIDEADYVEGVCAIGYVEEEEAADECDDDDWLPPDAEATMRRVRENALMRQELAKALAGPEGHTAGHSGDGSPSGDKD